MADGPALKMVQPVSDGAEVLLQVLDSPAFLRLCSKQSWLTCALLNRAACAFFHTRKGLRPLASALPRLPAGALPRKRLWQHLCLGALDFGEENGGYSLLAATEGSSDCLIRRDIGRTFPNCLTEQQLEALFRVLRAVTHRLEDIGYCQGMNFIAGVLLRAYTDAGLQEEELESLVYQSVISILFRHGLNQYFGEYFPKLRLTTLQFDCLVEAYLPELHARFEMYNISAEYYATSWFMTLFSYTLPYEHVLRVWDHFLCRGTKFLHCVGLALLQEASFWLLDLPFDETIQKLKTVGQTTAMSPTALIKTALNIKVTHRTLLDLENAIAGGGPERSPGSNKTLPSSLIEKIRLRNQWRLVPNGDSSAASSPGHKGCTDLAFLQDTLPDVRIPRDPVAERLALRLERIPNEEDSAATPDTQEMHHRRSRFGKLPGQMLRGIENQMRKARKASTTSRANSPQAQGPDSVTSISSASMLKGGPEALRRFGEALRTPWSRGKHQEGTKGSQEARSKHRSSSVPSPSRAARGSAISRANLGGLQDEDPNLSFFLGEVDGMRPPLAAEESSSVSPSEDDKTHFAKVEKRSRKQFGYVASGIGAVAALVPTRWV